MTKAIKKAALGRRQQPLLYAALAALWFSGVVWLGWNYGHILQGTSALETSAVSVLSMKIHGAAAMGFLMAFGALLLQHVPLGWKQPAHRPTGVALLSVCGALIITGWGLYYLGGESLRHGTSVVHWGLGVLLPVILWWHVRLARRTSEKE